MTQTVSSSLSDSARAALEARLEDLKIQRAQAEEESVSPGSAGDAADRSVNVDAMVRMGVLDDHIAEIELSLQARPSATAAGPADVAGIGSRVAVDFGDGDPEVFMLGPIEQFGASAAVITPSSPMGQALLGAHVGDEVTYRTTASKAVSATVVAVEN